MDNRQEHRYPVWEPVILSVGDGQADIHRSAHLIDISKSGLCVVTDLQIPAGTKVHVGFGHLSIEARINRCHRHGRELWALGAEITSLELNGANRAEALDRHVADENEPEEKAQRKNRPLASSAAFIQ